MKAILTAVAILALTATGGAAATQEEPVRAAVTRAGDAWGLDYVLNQDAPVWVFQRSALQVRPGPRRPWRLDQWRVETPGVALERHGAHDVLRSVTGGPVPRRVRLSMRPRAAELEAEYATLTFSDGAVALPSGQFDLFPLSSVEAAGALPSDLNGVTHGGGPAEITWRDARGPILFRGERHDAVTETNAETYVLFGDAAVVEGEAMTTVMDPALPAWIPAALGEFAPRVAAFYADRLGPGQTDHPTVMVSWTGPTPNVYSMGGSVMPGLIVMSFEGTGVVEPSADLTRMARWFIGHESAHFWLGQTVRYQAARDAWIMEGGADLMAVRAIQALEPAYDARAELQTSVDDCVALAANGPVATAADRGEHRANYACGAVWGLVAEGAMRARGGDWFDFVRGLLDANRADGVLTRDEWLAALTEASGDPSLGEGIARMLDQTPDPAAEIARLFDRAGVAYRREDGRVVLA
ncbi:hypothetical protein [Brevundimonas aurifodinae]|uniref:Peptidase M1 membrane alanine aminopeptidase domain-containing protein n=2 Tax=Brevundimonas TaxID=41275 RepID=A0ABV1NSX6_9CAUL|nr:MAG: hypothetical protein B7Z42_04235 [Brevundimonas sp. 12-68-7]OYX36007.1 MAG: hypothetical protein B7Z01_01505 [Brevundimonas subvibrioides]